MSIFASLAEQRILAAIAAGSFDDLPLQGQPLPRDDLSAVPEELRMGYKVLKNAGCLPEELQLHKELVSLQDLLDVCRSPEEEQRVQRQLTLKRLQYEMVMEKRGGRPAVREYQARMEAKLVE